MITINEQSAKRNNASGWVDYSEFCAEYNIELYHCKKYSLKDTDDYQFFKNKNYDILLLGGWQRLLPENILSTLNFSIPLLYTGDTELIQTALINYCCRYPVLSTLGTLEDKEEQNCCPSLGFLFASLALLLSWPSVHGNGAFVLIPLLFL